MAQLPLLVPLVFLALPVAHTTANLQSFVSKFEKEPEVQWKEIEDEIVATVTLEGSQMTADMAKTVEKTVKMLDDKVIAKIKKSWENDVATFNALMKDFETCHEARETKLEKIQTAEDKFKKSHDAFIDCKNGKTGEIIRHEDLIECRRVEAALLSDKTQECDEAAAEVAKFPGLGKECKKQCDNGYVTHITWGEQAFGEQINTTDQQSQECNDATEKHKIKKSECDSLRDGYIGKLKQCHAEQDAIEEDSCFRLDDTLALNRAYSKCYNPALTNYQKTVPILKKTEEDRNHEWSAVARIKCFLKVFTVKTNKEKTDQIDLCRNKEFSTTIYNVYYKEAYKKEERKKIEPFACTDTFVARYYTKQTDVKLAPFKKCRWCSGFKPTPPPTPEPTPLPTPFPTPPPTKKPTPAPTKAKGEGCKIFVHSKPDIKRRQPWLLVRYSSGRNQKTLRNKFDEASIASFKALGEQCKFCFYTKKNFKGTLLGSRIPLKETGLIKKKTEALKDAKSIKIIDSRFVSKCPAPSE